MARERGPGLRVRSAAEESLGSERGRLAAPGLAAMTEGGMEGSELWWGRRHGKVALSSEKGGMPVRLALAGDETWRARAKWRTRGHSEARHCLTSGISGERSESAACRG